MPEHEKPTQFVPAHCLRDPEEGDCPAYATNDLSWYANISTPCSYMCMGSKEDFFGGYDYRHRAGLVHIANHHIAPGKKQWTWGNHEFGYAWDRNLTDPDAKGEYGPYIEIMAGVYTDNQPDFSFLQPGETKSWSQYWYPIQKIGPAQHANLEAAISIRPRKGTWTIGVAVTREQPHVAIKIFPHLHKYNDLIYEPLNKEGLLNKAEIFFLALPHGTSQDIVNFLLNNNKRIIDLSADYRLTDPKVYKEWYGIPHMFVSTLKKAVYGLPEIYRNKIKMARQIANPGCYPTSAVLGLLPVLQNKLIDVSSIVLIQSLAQAVRAERLI